MQRALLTGANGTVGRALARRLREDGVDVVTWDRSQVPIDHYDAMERFVVAARPDVVFHLAIASQPTGRDGESWLVNHDWPSELAWICRIHAIRFVLTSTAMVFSDQAHGPFTIDSQPDAASGYGYEKRIAEARVLHQHPDAAVVRLGWQIGSSAAGVEPGTNTMLAALSAMHARGEVRASTRWLPACSWLEDTAVALVRVAESGRGIHMIDSNERWTFHEIVVALAKRFALPWSVTATEDFVQDQRMKDDRLGEASLRKRLAELP